MWKRHAIDVGMGNTYLYNLVVTSQHIAINSSTRAPLNAKKIAVKKVCNVDVVMFGPEL